MNKQNQEALQKQEEKIQNLTELVNKLSFSYNSPQSYYQNQKK